MGRGAMSSQRREPLLEKAAFGRRAGKFEGSAIGGARGADIAALCFELADRGGEHRIVIETVISDEALKGA